MNTKKMSKKELEFQTKYVEWIKAEADRLAFEKGNGLGSKVSKKQAALNGITSVVKNQRCYALLQEIKAMISEDLKKSDVEIYADLMEEIWKCLAFFQPKGVINIVEIDDIFDILKMCGFMLIKEESGNDERV